MQTYRHRQRGFLPWIATPLALAVLLALWLLRERGAQDQAVLMLALVAAILALIASTFAWLEIRDDGDALVVRFGPLPLARKRIPYASIRTVEEARSDLLDGWGIHWIPRRGQIWNVSGTRCVALTLEDGARLRLGTDEPERLAETIRVKLAA